MQADPEVLRGLAARCKTAKGPDRRLDYEVFQAFARKDAANFWDPDAGHFYTSSSDEVIALAERVLPAIKAFSANSPASSGWKLTFFRGMTPTSAPYGHWEANIRKHASDGATADGKTLPLAILGALLTALSAEGAQDV
ncbi:hypothetical protein [Methylobacterium pseudosasicola]|uniref:Uncharacterized protein n=1 Tax=Methylobacterium pseudosasicola TaxID=582667 RepID=A0A1I4V6U8_9HYPH|nr:hypothetical protein [Methylobacterium pseudosasicola]SFM96936.1 hypothetical protein SAMN05192568_10894 [Methylobacterium pseudosasicola]